MKNQALAVTARRWAKLLLKGLTVIVVVLLIAGFVYERLGQRRDKTRFTQIGRSLDIGGRSLNLHCVGEGSPTVVLEGPIGYAWTPIQRELAKSTRVCWYDRAGYGWSDPAPGARTSAAMADDLHALLRAAAIAPPYVLAGASFNGFPVRVFAGKYLDEVAGVVLVDASHEDQHEPPSMQSPANRLAAPVRSVLYALTPLAGQVGLLRLMSGSPAPRRELPPGVSQVEAQYVDFLAGLPQSFVTSTNESRNWQVSAHQARTAQRLGDRPLIVLTAGQPFVPRDPAAAKEAQDFHQVWVRELQPQLARLSTRGEQVIVENSGHGIAAEAVIAALRNVLTEIRGEPRNESASIQ